MRPGSKWSEVNGDGKRPWHDERVWPGYARLTMADVSKLKIALVQMAVGADKVANLRKAVQAVKEATRNGANIVALPVSSRCYW